MYSDFVSGETDDLTQDKGTFIGFLKNTVKRYGLVFEENSQKVVLLNGKNCMSCKQNHNKANIIVSNGVIKYKCDNRDYEYDLFKITVDPNAHSSLSNQEKVNAIYKGQAGLVDLLLAEFIGLIKCCDTKSLLIYNGMSKLWESLTLPAAAFVLGHWVRQSLDRHIDTMEECRKQFTKENSQYITFTEILDTTKKLYKQSENIGFMKNVVSPLVGHIYNNNTNTLLSGDPNYFPIANQMMVNLTTGEVSIRDYTYNFVYECNVNYLGNEYDCVNAKRFMKDVFRDNESIEYMQQLIGYFLSGKVNDRSFYIFWGVGRNGKSSLINILERIMGKGHYLNTLSDLVFINNGNRSTATPELVPIIGSRLCVVSETKEGETLNTTRIKQLTGDDDVPCRKLYGDSMTFRHSSKFIMITNEPPSFDVDQTSMTDRIKFIPFTARFVSENPSEGETLEDNNFISDLKSKYLDEVFTYFVQGAIKYNKNKILKVPESHRMARENYIESIDDLSSFIKEHCEIGKNLSVLSSEFLEKYNEWAESSNATKLNFKTIKCKMEKRKYDRRRNNKGMIYTGLGLKDEIVNI